MSKKSKSGKPRPKAKPSPPVKANWAGIRSKRLTEVDEFAAQVFAPPDPCLLDPYDWGPGGIPDGFPIPQSWFAPILPEVENEQDKGEA